MLTLDSRFRVNEPDVIAESVDGEVLIINLRSGAYYSSDGTGDQIWTLLAGRTPLRDVVERLTACYASGNGDIERAVLDFAGELEKEGLILGDATKPEPAAAAAPPSTAGGARFVAPALQKYTDFQELLLLDPIHEVDSAAGWPAAKPSK